MRAFTTATRAPLACASRRKFGQNSVSASTTSSGRKLRKIRPDRERKIHREIEDVLFAKTLAGQLLSGVRGSRDQQRDAFGKLRRICSTSPLTASTSPTETAWTQITAPGLGTSQGSGAGTCPMRPANPRGTCRERTI